MRDFIEKYTAYLLAELDKPLLLKTVIQRRLTMDSNTIAEIKKLETLIKNAEHRKSIGKQYKLFNPDTLVGRFLTSLEDYNDLIHDDNRKTRGETNILTIPKFIELVNSRINNIHNPPPKEYCVTLKTYIYAYSEDEAKSKVSDVFSNAHIVDAVIS